MDIESKARIICEYFEAGSQDEHYMGFVTKNDMGIPLSIALVFNLVKLNEGGQKEIEETWFDLCTTFGVDPEDDYESIEDIIE